MTKFPQDPLIGTKIGDRLTLVEKIGKGGMGTVYRARHELLERDFAVKVLRSDMRKDPVVVERFKREARAASRLEHPNVVYISDFDQMQDNRFYIVMEYIAGKSLRQILQDDGPLDISRACAILAQVSDALDYAHEKGVIHRDLKSENIFIHIQRGEERVKILDFGLAKVVSDALDFQSITSEGQIFGTPETMAPEQITSGQLDHRVDIYALGVLTYEMLIGKPPFSGPMLAVLMCHKKQPAPAPSLARSDVPAVLDSLVLKAMEKEPSRRFSRAAEMNSIYKMVLKEVTDSGKKITLVGANSREIRSPAISVETDSKAAIELSYRECLMEIAEQMNDRGIGSSHIKEQLDILRESSDNLAILREELNVSTRQFEKIEETGRERTSKLRHAIISLNMEYKALISSGASSEECSDIQYQLTELETQLEKLTISQEEQDNSFGDVINAVRRKIDESIYRLEEAYIGLSELIEASRHLIGSSSTLKTAFSRYDELKAARRV